MSVPHTTTLKENDLIHPEFESLVQRIIETVDKDKLAELRRDFHTRLRITLTQPDNTELIEDLWDFFYDWCVFERRLPESLDSLSQAEQTVWSHVKSGSQRGLYCIQKMGESSLRLKELYTGKVFTLNKRKQSDFLGISKGDIIEGRLLSEQDAETDSNFSFVRRPSFHPVEVHSYIKKKVRQFKRTQDYSTYQSWLWLLVGMYLKHRIYQHMPIEKIYDDNSRI